MQYNLLTINNLLAIETINNTYLLVGLSLIVVPILCYKSYKNRNMDTNKIPLLVVASLSVPVFIIGIHIRNVVLWDLAFCSFGACMSIVNSKKNLSMFNGCLVLSYVATFVTIYGFAMGRIGLGLLFLFVDIIAIGMYITFVAAKVAWDVIKIIIHVLITPETIKKEIRFKCPEAMKIEIQKEKQNCVECGIRDKNNKKIAEATIESDEGVSNTVYEGQVILAR